MDQERKGLHFTPQEFREVTASLEILNRAARQLTAATRQRDPIVLPVQSAKIVEEMDSVIETLQRFRDDMAKRGERKSTPKA